MLSRWIRGVPVRAFRTAGASFARKDLDSLKGIIGDLAREVQRERRKPKRLIASDSDHDDHSFPSQYGEQKIYENDDVFAGAAWQFDADEKTGKTRMVRPAHNMSLEPISEEEEETDEDDPQQFLANLTRKDFEKQGFDLEEMRKLDVEDEPDIPALRSKYSDFKKPGFRRIRSSSDISQNIGKFNEALDEESDDSDADLVIPIDRSPKSVGFKGEPKKKETKVEEEELDDGELSDETRQVREFEKILFPDREPTFRKYPKEENTSGYSRFMGLVRKSKAENGIEDSESDEEFSIKESNEMNKYDIDMREIYDLEPEEEEEELIEREYDPENSESEEDDEDKEEEKLKSLYYTEFYQKITDPKDFYNMLRYVFMSNPRSSSMLDYEYEDLDSETLISLNHLAQQFLDHEWEEHPFNILVRLATAKPFKESWIDSGLIENEKEDDFESTRLYLSEDEEDENRELENIYAQLEGDPTNDIRNAFERDMYLRQEIDLIGERADYSSMTELMDEIFEYEKERWLDGTTIRRMKEELLDEHFILEDKEMIERHAQVRADLSYEEEENPLEIAPHANVPEHLSLVRNHGGLEFSKTVPFIVENSDKPVDVDEPWKKIESAMKRGGKRCPICAPNRKCVPLMPVDYTVSVTQSLVIF
jgi:hypothetical protein